MNEFSLKILLLVFLFSSTQSLRAQIGPTIDWDKTIGGSAQDGITSLQQTSEGGYILGGYSSSGVSGDKSQPNRGTPITSDFWIIKLDMIGNKLWDRTFGGNDMDVPFSMQQTTDGGYILGGYSLSGRNGDKSQFSKGSSDFWVVKLDANGNKLWDKTYGGNADDHLAVLQQTADGGYILGGRSISDISGDKSEGNKGDYDFWVVKIDSVGNKLWDKTYGGNFSDYLNSLQQTADGGYLLGGESYSNANGNKTQPSFGASDFWAIKIDANGNIIWDKAFGGNGNDNLLSVIQTNGGGYILGGTTLSGANGTKTEASRGGVDYWIVKLDDNGNKLWDKTIGSWDNDILNNILQTKDGGYILGGLSSSGPGSEKSENSKGNIDFWLVKVDAAGSKLWDKTIGGNDYDRFYALQQTSDAGYVIGGSSNSNIGGSKSQACKGDLDGWVIKLDPACSALTATLKTLCNNKGTSLNIEISGNQFSPTFTQPWTLNYLKNGISKTISGNKNAVTIEENVSPGTQYSLVNIVYGKCSSSLTDSLIIQPKPTRPVITFDHNCLTDSINFSATGAPVKGNYAWYTSATSNTAFHINANGKFFIPYSTGIETIYVAAIDNRGCEGPRTQVDVNITPCPTLIPNIITNNEDGKNDTFTLQNLPKGNWHIQIFNRWGSNIYESENYQSNWPEKSVSDGTYFYFLWNSKTHQIFKGWVEVVH